VEITYHPTKDEKNIRERGLSFERATDFDFGTAVIAIDDRRDHGETRIAPLVVKIRRLPPYSSFRRRPGSTADMDPSLRRDDDMVGGKCQMLSIH
jgi:hypothetical protein